jgi:hypothetical protein
MRIKRDEDKEKLRYRMSNQKNTENVKYKML